MGYRAISQKTKKDGTSAWRVLWRANSGGKEKARHIPKEEYDALGINPKMSIIEANARLKMLNLDSERVRHEARKNAIHDRLSKEQNTECEHLPKAFADKFEKNHLTIKYLDNPKQLKKIQIHWRTAMRIIRAVDRPMSTWSDYPEPIYSYLLKNKVSWEYCKKLIRILNAWGYFMAKQTKSTFHPIPSPPARTRERIRDAYFDAGKSKESLPLTYQMLESKRSTLLPEHANWIMIAVWFGLRPGEVEYLRDEKKNQFRIGIQKGTKVLWVYQPKLTSLAREKRFKGIPILYPEQEQALALIKAGNFVCPLAKTVAAHFGENVNCYGPRKGFVSLMKEKGQRLENISRWLGHQSIATTQRFYENRNQVHWDEVA